VRVLQITDIWSQETLFEAEYPTNSRTSVVEPHCVAMCEPTGELQVVDVRSGQVVIDHQLEVRDVQSIQTLQAADALFVAASQAVRQQSDHKPIGQHDPITNGVVYAFSLKSGKPIWPGPATIRNRGLVAQPEDIPLLIFADRATTNEGSRGGKWQLRLLCIDKRTGETVYRDDDLPDTPATRFRVRGETEESPMVVVQTNSSTIQLAMTDRPRPPSPPANDDIEVPRETTERGLVGLGQRMGAVLRGTIVPDGDNSRRQPGAAEPRPAQPADDVPIPDDDD
jgi:hypothetical protein